MKIDSVNNTNFQAKLVLGKTVRPQNIREFAENVRAFEDFTSRIQGTFYAEKEFGENTKRINIFYKDGNYIDSCKYTEDLFEMRTDYFKEEIQTGIKYEMISGLFQQRTGKIASLLIFMRIPRPLHAGQAPNGLLKENIRGASSSMETPQSGQA